MKLPDGSEKWYVWKQSALVESENRERLLTPLSDPYKYEYPLDDYFDTPEEAVGYLRDCVAGTLYAEDREIARKLILCVETIVPLPDSEQPDLSVIFPEEDLEY